MPATPWPRSPSPSPSSITTTPNSSHSKPSLTTSHFRRPRSLTTNSPHASRRQPYPAPPYSLNSRTSTSSASSPISSPSHSFEASPVATFRPRSSSHDLVHLLGAQSPLTRPSTARATSSPTPLQHTTSSLLPKRGRPKKSAAGSDSHDNQIKTLQFDLESRFPSKPRKRSIKYTRVWDTRSTVVEISTSAAGMTDKMDVDREEVLSSRPPPPSYSKPWYPKPLDLDHRDPFRAAPVVPHRGSDPQSPRSKYGFSSSEISIQEGLGGVAGIPGVGLKGWGEASAAVGGARGKLKETEEEVERKPSLPGIKSLFGIAGNGAIENTSTISTPFPPLANLANSLLAQRTSVSSDNYGSASPSSSGRISRLSSFASFDTRDSVSTVYSGPMDRGSVGEGSGWWKEKSGSMGSVLDEGEKWERKSSAGSEWERRMSMAGMKSRRGSEHVLTRTSDRQESIPSGRKMSYSGAAPPAFGPYSMGAHLVPLAEVSGSTENGFPGPITPVSPRRGSVAIAPSDRETPEIPRRASDGDKLIVSLFSKVAGAATLNPQAGPGTPQEDVLPTPLSVLAPASASTANDRERAARRASHASLPAMELNSPGLGSVEGFRSHPYANASRERASSTQRRNSKSPTDPHESQLRVSATAFQIKSDPYEPAAGSSSTRQDLVEFLPKFPNAKLQAEEALMYTSPFSHSPMDISHRSDPYAGSVPLTPDRRGFVPQLYRPLSVTAAPVPSVFGTVLPEEFKRQEGSENSTARSSPSSHSQSSVHGPLRQQPYQPIRIYPANGMPTAELPGAVSVNENGPQGPGEHGTVINTPTGPRYICNFCSKSFTRPSSLRIHTYSHTGERPYVCVWAHCGRSFSVQSNLKRHLKTHTTEGPEVSDDVAMADNFYDQDGRSGSAEQPLQQPKMWWQSTPPGTQGHESERDQRLNRHRSERDATPRGREIRKGVQLALGSGRDADEEDELAEDN